MRVVKVLKISDLAGEAGLIALWGVAIGVFLWGCGLDVAVQMWLARHYNQTFNDITITLGQLGLGRTLVWGCLLGGLGVAFWCRPVRASWGYYVGLCVGIADQLRVWCTQGLKWTRFWDGVNPVARGLLVGVPVLAVTGVVQIVLKVLVGRARPKEVLWNGWDPYVLNPIWRHGSYDSHYLSFPSGHSCSTWAVAVVLMLVWPKGRWLTAVCAVAASAARFLALTPHFMGDVVAGGALGGALAYFLVAGMNLNEAKRRS